MTDPAGKILWKNYSLLASIFAIVVIPVCLVLLIPYAHGYLGDKQPLGTTMKSFWESEQWQHCWLVIPAVVFILYSSRAKLLSIPAKGANLGIVFLLFGLSLFWVGQRVENYYIGFFSIHILLGAMVVWLFGWRWFFASIFAYGFLLFVWPLYFLEQNLTLTLRMLMVHASGVVLNLIGLPVIQNGSGLYSAPDAMLGLKAGERFMVDVADPCSGIRSLFALMMVSSLYAHFAVRGFFAKWILFSCSVPFAIFGNLCRILMLTFGILVMGSEKAIGTLEHPSFFHMLAGYLVFAVALVGMILLGWILNNWKAWVSNFKIRGSGGGPESKAATNGPEATPNEIY